MDITISTVQNRNGGKTFKVSDGVSDMYVAQDPTLNDTTWFVYSEGEVCNESATLGDAINGAVENLATLAESASVEACANCARQAKYSATPEPCYAHGGPA